MFCRVLYRVIGFVLGFEMLVDMHLPRRNSIESEAVLRRGKLRGLS